MLRRYRRLSLKQISEFLQNKVGVKVKKSKIVRAKTYVLKKIDGDGDEQTPNCTLSDQAQIT